MSIRQNENVNKHNSLDTLSSGINRKGDTRTPLTQNKVVMIGGILLIAMTLFSLIAVLFASEGFVAPVKDDTTRVLVSQNWFTGVEASEEMSESEEIFTVVSRYWRILLKWLFRLHDYPEITAGELYERINSDVPLLLIDVRTTADYDGTGYSKYGHIPNAISIPMIELETRVGEIQSYKDKEVITICQGGGLSLAAVDVLNKAGFTNVTSLKGGTDNWDRKGYPMITP